MTQRGLLADPIRTGIRGAVVAGVALLAIAALILATSLATEDAVDHGLIATHADAVLGTNDVALKAVAQALLLAEDHSLGVADDASVAVAINEATVRLEALQAAAADLDRLLPTARTLEQANHVATRSGEILELAVDGNVESAADALESDIKPSFEALRDTSASHRNASVDSLSTTAGIASQASNVVRFLVAFLLPLALVVAYRMVGRRQLRAAEAQLETRLAAEHEVIRAKDEFIANVSHELRTPLTSIYGFSEVLLDMGLVDPDSAMDLIGLINTESAELGRMVEDLVASARAEAGRLVYTIETVDVAEAVDGVIGSVARERTDIRMDVAADPVLADPVRLRQIIRNLISNAVRYGGPQIEVTSRREGDRVLVTVADDGSGVSDDMVPRLFTRFVHEGNEALTVGSVGLGLAVVKSLADGMGGGVEYRHADGWSRFTFWLPSATNAEWAADVGPAMHKAELTAAATAIEDA